jgi:hypothetical protein
MAIITLRVSAGIQGTRAAFQWLRHFKNFFCSRLHYGNKTFEMTAVEWLKEKTSDMTIHKTHLNDTISEWQEGYNVALEDVNKLLNKALEMEKQQIIDAYIEGYSSNLNAGDSEKYYNETYKKPLK